MDAADQSSDSPFLRSEAHGVLNSLRADGNLERALPRSKLADDIDDLRRRMAETFLKEASFTADPVILISRQLDVKINEYMRQWSLRRKKAR